ncbi:MAG TPA: N-acetylmuramoyl-L-alanine amidase, partial [Terriglobales bacterium]
AFEEFVRRYPRHRLTGEARAALAELTEQAAAVKAKDSNPSENSAVAEPEKREPGPAAKAPDEEAARSAVRLVRVTGVRHLSLPDYTRITIDLERDVPYESQRIDNPARVYFDLAGTELDSALLGKTLEVDDDFLRQIRIAQYQPDRARIVLDMSSLCEYSSFVLSNPSRLVIDVQPQKNGGTEAAGTGSRTREDARAYTIADSRKKVIVEPDEDDVSDPTLKPEAGAVKVASRTVPQNSPRSDKTPVARKTKTFPARDIREAKPTSNGDRSLIRTLGLKIGKIVIDPGHGGYDTGTIGPKGLAEKTLVLDVSRRLGKLLQTRLGADVVHTRSDDTFIPLETRTAIANQEQADLFVSIHANSSRDPDARGVETYYLNFTSSEEALEVAARENATSETSIHELQDLVKKIALKDKIEESREFATDVQQAVHSTLAAKTPAIRDRGVKKAPFIVLIGANMPSILAEISFVSNPADERKLKTAQYRQRIAESLYRGIAKYVSGLSGLKVASRVEKNLPQ